MLMNDFYFIDIIGIIGVAIVIITYFLLQINKISSEALSYSLFNIIGSSLIVLSLLEHWNLASFLIEMCWIMISFIGVFKYFKRKVSKINVDMKGI